VSSEEGLIVFDSAGEIVGIDAIETPGTPRRPCCATMQW
jgi:hypothetical protein